MPKLILVQMEKLTFLYLKACFSFGIIIVLLFKPITCKET